MIKTILFVLLLAAGSVFAEEDKNAVAYVNDCDSYGQLAFSTVYLKTHPVTFEDGVKRLMTKDEFIARFKAYMGRSNISEEETNRLLNGMLQTWDTETTADPVDLYTHYRAECEKTGRK